MSTDEKSNRQQYLWVISQRSRRLDAAESRRPAVSITHAIAPTTGIPHVPVSDRANVA